MDAQLTLFGATQKAPTLRRPRSHLSKAQRVALRQQAYDRYHFVRSTAIRTLSRERGGLTDRTREAIFAEAELVAHHAAERVYRNAGYFDCPNECGRLVTPGYAECPNCTSAALG